MVNNATQTIRRPAAYYRHLLPAEAAGAAALENDHSAAGKASTMLNAHYQLQSSRSSSSSDAMLALPPSTDVHNDSPTASGVLETACETELASGSGRSEPKHLCFPGTCSIKWRLCGCENAASFGSPELLSRSAALSQVALLPQDAKGSSIEDSLPADVYDINGQQLDCESPATICVHLDYFARLEFACCFSAWIAFVML